MSEAYLPQSRISQSLLRSPARQNGGPGRISMAVFRRTHGATRIAIAPRVTAAGTMTSGHSDEMVARVDLVMMRTSACRSSRGRH